MLFLGIDMGGSATRWVVRDPTGAIVARGRTAGASAHIEQAAGRAAFEAALIPIARTLPAPLAGAHLGLTGAGVYPATQVQVVAAQALGLAPAVVGICNDVVLAWHAAFPAGGGHLIYAGTGSVGVSIAADKTVTMVGGRGVLIDDAGGAAWIALRALDQVCRRIDHHGAPVGAEALARALADSLGGPDWEDMRRYVYGRDRGAVGLLAQAVAQAARAGDAVALALLQQAGAELARLGQALLARCGRAPVAALGGAFALHPAIGAGLRDGLSGVTLDWPQIDAAAHAATMAREAATGRTA